MLDRGENVENLDIADLVTAAVRGDIHGSVQVPRLGEAICSLEQAGLIVEIRVQHVRIACELRNSVDEGKHATVFGIGGVELLRRFKDNNRAAGVFAFHVLLLDKRKQLFY